MQVRDFSFCSWLVIEIVLMSILVSGQERSIIYKSCITPNNQPGTCLKLTTCKTVNELVKRRNEPKVLDFLRKSHCGYEGKDIVVCCLNSTKEIEIAQNGTQHPVQKTQETSEPKKPGSKQQKSIPESLKLSSTEYHLCGISNGTRSRIVGGREAELGSWPWIAALGYPMKNGSISYRCGGTLITERHVLTAAHCILFGGGRPTVIRLGDLNLNDNMEDEAYPVTIEIQKATTHEQYRQNPQVVNDIALITMKTPVIFNKLIRPLCLPIWPSMKKTNAFQYKDLYIIGWGTTVSGELVNPMALHEAQVPAYDDEKCKISYKGSINSLIDERVICAGGNGKDACQGDSGGPLIASHHSVAYLIGIVSYGQGCGDPQFPGVYTRVTHYMDWIYKYAELKDCNTEPTTCIKPPRSRLTHYENIPCGKSNQTTEGIIDGQDAKPGSWPWIAAIQYDIDETTYWCSGVLISDRHVLTSATCLVISREHRIKEVRLRTLQLATYGAKLQEEIAKIALDVPVEDIIIHEGFREKSHENDIGIIILAMSVPFSAALLPICLPSKSEIKNKNFENRTLISPGWSLEYDDETRATDPLRESNYLVYNDEKCKQIYRGDLNAVVDERVICAAKHDNKTCHADNGAPLIGEENGAFYIIGIVSYGKARCGDLNYPDIYTRVSYFTNWIFENSRYTE